MSESSPAETARPFPGLGQALLMVLLLWVFTALFGVATELVYTAIAGDEPPENSPWMLLAMNSLGFFAASWLGWRLTRAPASRVFPLRPISPRLLLAMAPVCVGILVVTSEIDTLLRHLPQPEILRSYMRLADEIFFALLQADPWGVLLAVVVMAPVTEEVFFRGLLLHGFLPRYGPVRAVVFSALLFSIAHLTPNQLVIAVAAGLFLGWLYVHTRNLLVPIVAHAGINITGTVALRLTAGEVTELPETVAFMPWWVDLGGLVLLGAGLVWLRRELRDSPAAT